MKAFSPKSRRERVLLVVLIFSLMAGSYLMMRVKNLIRDAAVLDEQWQESEQKVSQTRPARPVASNIVALRNEMMALQDKIEQETKTLNGFKNSFIDLSQNDAIATMRTHITSLAENQQLRLLSIRAADISLDTLAGVKARDGEDELARPLFDVKMSGSFTQLNQFILGLKNLPYSVVVTKLSVSINRDEQRAGNTGQSLLTLLTLAI